MTLNHALVLLMFSSMTAAASTVIYVGWRRCFHPTIRVTGVQDEYDGPDGQLCGEITLRIDFYAPPFGVLHLWNFHLLAPKKFIDRGILMAFIVAESGPVPCEWTPKQSRDAMRYGVLAPNEQCRVYVTLRMVVPEGRRKGKRLWYFFLDTKLSVSYDVSGRVKKQKIPANKVGYVRDFDSHHFPRLVKDGEYGQVNGNPNQGSNAMDVDSSAIRLLPSKSYSEWEQERYEPGHELNFPFGTRDRFANGQPYRRAFIDEWNACYDHYQKEIASREDTI